MNVEDTKSFCALMHAAMADFGIVGNGAFIKLAQEFGFELKERQTYNLLNGAVMRIPPTTARTLFQIMEVIAGDDPDDSEQASLISLRRLIERVDVPLERTLRDALRAKGVRHISRIIATLRQTGVLPQHLPTQ